MKIPAQYYFFVQYKMSEKALKFGDVETNKKKIMLLTNQLL